MIHKESFISPPAKILLSKMSERMFHTLLEPHPSSSIYTPLFSGHKSDRHKDPSQDRVVYEEEQNRVIVTLSGACHQIPSPTTLPLKRDPGPHRHY